MGEFSFRLVGVFRCGRRPLLSLETHIDCLGYPDLVSKSLHALFGRFQS